MNKKLNRKERKEKKGTGGSSKASLHAKSFVFDRQTVFIGSLNLDPRATLHNTEIGVVLESTEIGGGMAEWFDANITFSHCSNGAETNACLAADTDVFVENHHIVFVA